MPNDFIACPIENTLKLINRKWIIVLIRDMFTGKKHFQEFKKDKTDLSSTVLSDTLKYMEKNGLITKKIVTKGNKTLTEYNLTSKGFKLNRLLYDMALFGLNELECEEGFDPEMLDYYENYYANLLKIK